MVKAVFSEGMATSWTQGSNLSPEKSGLKLQSCSILTNTLPDPSFSFVLRQP